MVAALIAMVIVAMMGLSIRSGGSASGGDYAAEPFALTDLVIESGQHRHAFTVELAVTSAQKSRGLMFRESLAPDAGMLFLYPEEGPVAMWMKNTLIPLDMLFIDARGRIASLHEGAVPHSRMTISSAGPVIAVLEVQGGTVARLGLSVGDRVRAPGLP